jgi:toxin-antitoxin system PIN domain toxin
VILVDANVLLYAVNQDAARHREARRWLDDALSGGATIGFAWLVVLAFLRLSTKEELFPRPLSPEQAFDRVEAWLSQPTAVIAEPTSRHEQVLRRLLGAVGLGGNLVSDAHLAALAVEHRGTVASYDSDFGRFEGVRWLRPGG